MYNFKHTFYRFISPMLKFAVVAGCFYFIYQKLEVNKTLTLSEFYSTFSQIFKANFLLFGFVFSLTFLNWFFEILKWKILVGTRQTINFKTAKIQCLSALTFSLATPNRIGDYVAKAMYYPKKQTKMIVGLNAIGQFAQLFITLIFGIIGLVYLYLNFGFGVSLNLNFLGILAMVILIVLLTKKGRFYTFRAFQFFGAIPSAIHFKVLTISALRYLIFSHQFYFLMVLFNLQTTYLPSMMAIFSMYLLASVVPTFSIFDWVVKGSAAVVVFSFLELNSLVILEISTLMWLLNFALPALVGSLFVCQFKTTKTFAPSL